MNIDIRTAGVGLVLWCEVGFVAAVIFGQWCKRRERQ